MKDKEFILSKVREIKIYYELFLKWDVKELDTTCGYLNSIFKSLEELEEMIRKED